MMMMMKVSSKSHNWRGRGVKTETNKPSLAVTVAKQWWMLTAKFSLRAEFFDTDTRGGLSNGWSTQFCIKPQRYTIQLILQLNTVHLATGVSQLRVQEFGTVYPPHCGSLTLNLDT